MNIYHGDTEARRKIELLYEDYRKHYWSSY